jgi:hypothetical protein
MKIEVDALKLNIITSIILRVLIIVEIIKVSYNNYSTYPYRTTLTASQTKRKFFRVYITTVPVET